MNTPINKMIPLSSLVVVGFLAVAALVAVIPVSYTTLMTDKYCPYIWLMPACYLVTLGYALILLSLAMSKRSLFVIGWLPVFLLALTGTIAELVADDVCPKTGGGIPMCYFSLIFSMVIGAFYFLWQKTKASKYV